MCGMAGCGRAGMSPPRAPPKEKTMDEEALNISIRKFLKMVGVNSQREIEHAVAKALAAGTTADAFPAVMTLTIPALGLNVSFDGTIALR
jgi:uncharacterized protein (DUF2062 family)